MSPSPRLPVQEHTESYADPLAPGNSPIVLANPSDLGTDPASPLDTVRPLLSYSDALTPLEGEDTAIRIGFLNIGGLPHHRTPKANKLRQFIQSCQFLVFGLSEMNTIWSRVLSYHRPYALFQRWLGSDTRTRADWNTHLAFHATHAYGGTGLLTRGITSSRVHKSGGDPTGLG